MKPKSACFWIFTIGIISILVLPELIQDGMFMDGLLYSSVAKNLAEGRGSLWFLEYTQTMHTPFFHEQPPIGIWGQALFFKIFGSSIYSERIYCLFTLIFSIYLIQILWKNVVKDIPGLKAFGWYPVLLFGIIPVVFWAYSNNVLEDTMVVYALAITNLIFSSSKSDGRKYFRFTVAGILLFMAFMTKGFVGLFPIALPFFLWVIYRDKPFLKVVIDSAILTAIPVAIFFVLILVDEDAKLCLNTYLFERVFNSIQSVSNVSRRTMIMEKLVLQMLLPIIITSSLLLIQRFKFNVKLDKSQKKQSLIFLLIGISASLPLMVTKEQRTFYLVTSMPFYAISLALISGNAVKLLVNNLSLSTSLKYFIRILSVLILVTALTLTITKVGNASRDGEILHDIYLIGPKIPQGEIICVDTDTWFKYNIHSYFIRHYNISLSTDKNCRYFVFDKQYANTLNMDKLKYIPLDTKKYDLYKLINTKNP